MGIGVDNILNSLNSLSAEKKLDKDKKDFSAVDFSSIAADFSSILSNQFATQFSFKNPSNNIANIAMEQLSNFKAQNPSAKTVTEDKKEKLETKVQENKKEENSTDKIESISLKEEDVQVSNQDKKEVESQNTISSNKKLSSEQAEQENSLKQLENVTKNKEENMDDVLSVKVSKDDVQTSNKTTMNKAISTDTDMIDELNIEDVSIEIEENIVVDVEEAVEQPILEDVQETDLKPELKAEISKEGNNKTFGVLEKADKETTKILKDLKEPISEKMDIEKNKAEISTENPTQEMDSLLQEMEPEKPVMIKSAVVEKIDLKDVLEPKNSIMPSTSSNLGQNFSGQNPEQNPQAFSQNNSSILFGIGNVAQNTIIGSSFDNILQVNKMDMHKTISDQVLKNIKGKITQENSQISMILKPSHLGKVTLSVINQKGVLSAEIKTETKQAADALNKSIEEVKNALKEQGVICSNLVVKVEENAKSSNMNFQQNFREFKDEGHQGQNQSASHQKDDENYKENTMNMFDAPLQDDEIEESITSQNDKVVDYRV